jgi:ribosome maturation factor RimP
LNRTPLEERLETLVAPIVAESGFELVRVKMMGRSEQVLQIMAERPDKTMSANDCAKLSRAIAVTLDEADPIAGAYKLEVSSPGIDRPLTRPADFHDWQGYDARIELTELIEGRKRLTGVLAGVDGDNVCFDIEGEDETALIPMAAIATAKLLLTDDLIRETLKAAKEAATDLNDEDEMTNSSTIGGDQE